MTRGGCSLPPLGAAALFSVLPLAALLVGAPPLPPGACCSRCAVGQPSSSVSMARLSGLVIHSVSAGRLSCASSDRSLRACRARLAAQGSKPLSYSHAGKRLPCVRAVQQPPTRPA